ncbi:natural killer cells antigen CD94-like isoform X2 [Elephas maximus indicus]|uniref:natural killer cells antigen CD94-like isoform X1 n=1 Tax=Elephas maximus indicus TaxID=99487 RepID=UPI002115F444|nr:natural killer cells antigen CD94-like isoform X1 [Elephas maximus indicus]XP_049738408.1 natural killer cells antigen CD94-like isoform X2 [Elephas maximus indicus]
MAAFQNNLWNLISGALAVVCLLLMAALGILLKNSFATENIQPIPSPGFSPGFTLEPKKGSGCCPCQEKWIGYRCNCYFFSNEEKTWAESRDFCASHNSSLLQLESKDEFSFRISSGLYYWIGLTYNERRGAWLWEDGSALSRNLFPLFQTLNRQNCIVYKPSGSILDEDCRERFPFICKALRN